MMSSTPSRPIAVLWFPFFFAAAFALLGMLAFAAPSPHSIPIAIVGTDQQTARVDQELSDVAPGGFVLRRVPGTAEVRSAVETGDAVAGYSLERARGSTLFVASAQSATRASYLQAVFADVIAPDADAGPITMYDVVPVASGDVSGVGMFFFALPLLLVGLITSIVLLQFAGWTVAKKMATIAATGAFATVVTYALALALHILPPAPGLLPVGFLLTQGIGWLTSGVAVLAKRFFMPISMTFVLVLGIPTAGATVNADMLPSFLSFLHAVLPFGQYIDAARSLAYFDGRGAWQPVGGVFLWAMVGIGLLAVAHRRGRRAAEKAQMAAAAVQHASL